MRNDDAVAVKGHVAHTKLNSTRPPVGGRHGVFADPQEEEERGRCKVRHGPALSVRGSRCGLSLELSHDGDGDGELGSRGGILPVIGFEEAAELYKAFAAARDFRGVFESTQLEGLANGADCAVH